MPPLCVGPSLSAGGASMPCTKGCRADYQYTAKSCGNKNRLSNNITLKY
jgi:hypothetical protein